MRHPIQPLEKYNLGTLRFKKNKIVDFLLEFGPYDLNKLATMDFTDEDREQLAQLIGYSLSGFGKLSYVSDETYELAESQKQLTCNHIKILKAIFNSILCLTSEGVEFMSRTELASRIAQDAQKGYDIVKRLK